MKESSGKGNMKGARPPGPSQLHKSIGDGIGRNTGKPDQVMPGKGKGKDKK